MVSFKNCSFGNNVDQTDQLQHLYQQDRFSDQCITQKNSQSIDIGEEAFVDLFANTHTEYNLNYLDSLGLLTFPIKNKSKQQNTHITNFQFEYDKNLKQETFMLCFDLLDKDK